MLLELVALTDGPKRVLQLFNLRRAERCRWPRCTRRCFPLYLLVANLELHDEAIDVRVRFRVCGLELFTRSET